MFQSVLWEQDGVTYLISGYRYRFGCTDHVRYGS